MSNLETLLEAARFVELQEQEQQAAAINTILPKPPPPPPPPQITAPVASSSPQTLRPHSTLLISTSAGSNVLTAQVATILRKDVTTTTTNGGSAVSTAAAATPLPRRVLNNSFDIMNPLIIDEGSGGGDGAKRRQPPLVFRAGTREVHNKLEKDRRAHLKECFDVLKKQLPAGQDEKKTSTLSILDSAYRYIQGLKRKERELEYEMERLARDKIAAQQKLASLKKDISLHYDNVDFSKILPDSLEADDDVTLTAVANGNSYLSDDENKQHGIVFQATTTTEHGTSPITVATPVVVNGSNLANGVVTTTTATTTSTQKADRSSSIQIPLFGSKIAIATTPVGNSMKEGPHHQQQTLSVVPVGYQVPQGLVLQKLAIMPKGLSDLGPLVPTHFITTTTQPQHHHQMNGTTTKVVPLVNAQYVVVSRPS